MTTWKACHQMEMLSCVIAFMSNTVLTHRPKDVGLSVTATGITLTYNQVFHRQLDGHEFEQALGVGDIWGSLVCCSQWGHKDSDTIEQQNWMKIGDFTVIKILFSCFHTIHYYIFLFSPSNT